MAGPTGPQDIVKDPIIYSDIPKITTSRLM